MILQRNRDWPEKSDALLEKAFSEGRNQLFEHEVYEILGWLGIQTPYYAFISDSALIDRNFLSRFGSSHVVLKIAADSIIHKKKAGGIKIVYKDLDFVKFSCDEMLCNFKKNNTEVRGILIADFIDYSQEIGNETLIGFRETDSFGPVLSFSKGGSDAEHFAERYSPPNLVMVPVTIKWARDLLSSTEIYKKYTAEKREKQIEIINKAQVRLSDLAMEFSNFFPGKSRFYIREFEINPFIFDRDDNYLAIDGYASFFPKKSKSFTAFPSPDTESIAPFFFPENIAVLGVSASDNEKSGNIIVKNLFRAGRENIYCINPRGGEINIDGRNVTLYKSITDVTVPVDFAVITVPAEAVLESVKECALVKIKTMLLISGGFSESTNNRELEDKILSIAVKNKIRVMGPNCLGIYHSEGKVNTFFIPENKFSIRTGLRQNLAILSQSGALGIVEIFNLRNAVSPRAIVSYGNELDTGPCDLVEYFAQDRNIEVIGLYIEGFKEGEGRRFFNIVSKIKKPVVVYKAGRTEAGQLATQSHTASMSGEYAVARAGMKQAGIIVAETMADHTGFIKTFSLFSGLNVSNRRIAVVTNAGYEKAGAADNIGGLEIAELDKETEEALRKIIPPFVKPEPLLDLTPMADDRTYIKSIEILLSCRNIDGLLVSIIPYASPLHTTDQEIKEYDKNIASEMVRVVKKYKKPVMVSTGIEAGTDGNYSMLSAALDSGGIPAFSSSEKAMKYLNAFFRYKLIKEKNIMSEWLKHD